MKNCTKIFAVFIALVVPFSILIPSKSHSYDESHDEAGEWALNVVEDMDATADEVHAYVQAAYASVKAKWGIDLKQRNHDSIVGEIERKKVEIEKLSYDINDL